MGSEAEPPAGVQGRGRAPGGGSGGRRPHEADVPTRFKFVFKTVIFQCTCYSFARNDVLFELLLLWSDLWIHSHNLLSSYCRTASEHHPTGAWVVLRVDRSAHGKNRTSPTPSPSPSLPPVPFPPLPSLPLEVGPST